MTNPLSGTVAATRNAAGQILSLADPKGNKRNYQYNADGLLTGFTDALGNKWAYDYDGAARAATRTDPAGATAQGRLHPGQSHRRPDRGRYASSRSTTPASSATASIASPATPIPSATS